MRLGVFVKGKLIISTESVEAAATAAAGARVPGVGRDDVEILQLCQDHPKEALSDCDECSALVGSDGGWDTEDQAQR